MGLILATIFAKISSSEATLVNGLTDCTVLYLLRKPRSRHEVQRCVFGSGLMTEEVGNIVCLMNQVEKG